MASITPRTLHYYDEIGLLRVIAFEIGVRKLSYGGKYGNGREGNWQNNRAFWEGE